MKEYILLCLFLLCPVLSMDLPESCEPNQFYDSGTMKCSTCSNNSSLIKSADGFGCQCEQGSVPNGLLKCKMCNSTEVVSSDGVSCVPRKCQRDSSNSLACRKCPSDFIYVTQNHDGSPMREVQCVKCARGYTAVKNRCVHCESCTCNKNEVVVRGKCLPKPFLTNRPKYEEKLLHPNVLLEIVKFEYLCTKGDNRSCRSLANECVRHFYTTEKGGPCRLWSGRDVMRPSGLPKLLSEASATTKSPGEIHLASGKVSIEMVVANHTYSGGVSVRGSEQKIRHCLLPAVIELGRDFTYNCNINLTELEVFDGNGTFAPYLVVNGDYVNLPVTMKKPGDYTVQRGEWASNQFSRYFLVTSSVTATSNYTETTYLRAMAVNVKVHKDKTKNKLKVMFSLEVQYATTSPLSSSVKVSLRVVHELPGAGILKGLEIWGGLLGAVLSLYAVSQWRGAVRRGGLHATLLPIMAGCVADALYFSAIFSSLHALAAEFGDLGLKLPLSRAEEHTVSALIYAAFALKLIKVLYLNYKQCSNDIFLIDWSEYNTSLKELVLLDKSSNWSSCMVAREWSLMAARRRVSPAYTVFTTFVIYNFLTPWLNSLPKSSTYRLVVGAVAWWGSYSLFLASRWLLDRVRGSPTGALLKVCKEAEVSLFVFQEEAYAHYVHGRNDESPEARPLSGPLSCCRVACAPQLRVVYKQLCLTNMGGLGDNGARKALLSRFLAAFFERALDGMSWVASERSITERLLDIEVTSREATTTSVLLYDPENTTPSCFVMTWWGEEWSMATYDAMLFGCVMAAGGDQLVAAVVTLVVWKISASLRQWIGDRNLTTKTEAELI